MVEPSLTFRHSHFIKTGAFSGLIFSAHKTLSSDLVLFPSHFQTLFAMWNISQGKFTLFLPKKQLPQSHAIQPYIYIQIYIHMYIYIYIYILQQAKLSKVPPED